MFQNKGSIYTCIEYPKGEFGVCVKSFGLYQSYRCKSGTYDVVLGEIDR